MSTIAAGTTTGTALVNTGDTTGNLVLQTNGTTAALTLNTSQAVGVGSSPSYGTSGQVLTSAGSGAAPTWTTLNSVSSVNRSAITGAYTLAASDKGYLIDCTSGTFTLSITAAATLGAGWWCYVGNSGTGFVTLDPNGSETITREGVALTTWVLWSQEVCLLVCDGTGFYYTNLQKGQVTQTVSSSVASVTFATGINYRSNLQLSIAYMTVSATSKTQIEIKSSSDYPSRSSEIGISGTTIGAYNGAGGSQNIIGGGCDNIGSGKTTGYDKAFIIADFSMNSDSILMKYTGQWGGSTQYQYTQGQKTWVSNANQTNADHITLSQNSGNITAGTFTLKEI